MRPDRTSVVYTNILKNLFPPDVPVLLGGIEASLRRVTHYDYWDDKLRKSILIDSKADLLVYGMGEMPLKRIISELQSGKKLDQLTNVPQTAFFSDKKDISQQEIDIWLYSHEECESDKLKQAKNFKV